MVALTIRTRAEAIAANAGLLCGVGVGQTARTNLVIRNGLIVEWIRAPDLPGDNGGSGIASARTAWTSDARASRLTSIIRPRRAR
jgi:hypothetical protein